LFRDKAFSGRSYIIGRDNHQLKFLMGRKPYNIRNWWVCWIRRGCQKRGKRTERGYKRRREKPFKPKRL